MGARNKTDFPENPRLARHVWKGKTKKSKKIINSCCSLQEMQSVIGKPLRAVFQ